MEKVEQLKLPEGATIEIRTPSKTWIATNKVPTEGRFRINVPMVPLKGKKR